MKTIADWRAESLLRRREKEYDEFGQDPAWVMYRAPDGTPEPEATKLALAQQLVELLKPAPGSTLIDVGCGEGHITRRLLAHFAQVVGTDLSQGMLDRAAQVLEGVSLHRAPADDLPFPDGSFSRALCYGVFILFPDFAYARKAFHEILRVVEPGGIALLGDIPDAAKRGLSFEERERRRRPAPRAMVDALRRSVMDSIFGVRPHGFYPMSFFQDLSADEGHVCRVVPQPAELLRGAWRVNVVITKRPA